MKNILKRKIFLLPIGLLLLSVPAFADRCNQDLEQSKAREAKRFFYAIKLIPKGQKISDTSIETNELEDRLLTNVVRKKNEIVGKVAARDIQELEIIVRDAIK